MGPTGPDAIAVILAGPFLIVVVILRTAGRHKVRIDAATELASKFARDGVRLDGPEATLDLLDVISFYGSGARHVGT